MKKIINIIAMILIIGAAAIVTNTNKLDNELNKDDFKIIDTYVTDSNSTVIEFNDNSYAVINYSKDIYEFIPCELGDWEVKVNNKDELIMVIKSYMSYKYNMHDAEIENDEIFKNGNLM